MNRAFINPRQMAKAGTPGAYAAVIRHTGRTSGRQYETPVGAVPADGGFVIALPYGLHADWAKNVLASGSATIVHEGRTYPVTGAELVPMQEAAHFFSRGDQRAHILFAVAHCIRFQMAESAEV